jgi:anti-anti-sigma factor
VDAARETRLVVDLTRLQFCDSSGLRALTGAAEEMLAGGGRAVIVPPVDDAAAQRFARVGAGELLPLRSSAAEALAALDATPS